MEKIDVAIKTGKRFKRKNEDVWWWVEADRVWAKIDGEDVIVYVTPSQMIADDYEIEP